MSGPGRGVRRAAVVVLGSLALTGCAGAAGTRAGGEPPPLVLRIGTEEPRGRPAAQQVEQMVLEVADRSDGRLALEPVFSAVGRDQPSWDQVLARQVVDGELDLAVVPARAWDTEGVDSLVALQAPLLVGTEEHMAAVVEDDALAGDLLAGLDAVGVEGLALLPEGLRHLFVTGGGDASLGTFDGQVVRAPRSDTTWALLEAFGARPTDAQLQASGAVGLESELSLAGSFPATAAMLGDLTLYPKINTLVVGGERFDGLSEEDRRVLQEAALATRDAAVADLPEDADLAAAWCASGGSVVLVGPEELAAARTAARPVTAALRADAGTAALMDRVAAVEVTTTSPTVDACDAPGATVAAGRPAEPGGGTLPDGTYRVEFTEDYLRGAGLDAAAVRRNHGVWTFVLQDGRWSGDQRSSEVEESFGSEYRVEGDQLWWGFDDAGGVEEHLLRWHVDGQGRLLFEPLDVDPAALFHFGLPWTPVE